MSLHSQRTETVTVSWDDYDRERAILTALRMASCRPDWPKPKTGVRNIEYARDVIRTRAVLEALLALSRDEDMRG